MACNSSHEERQGGLAVALGVLSLPLKGALADPAPSFILGGSVIRGAGTVQRLKTDNSVALSNLDQD
jgi:hypothetical protein